MAQLTASGQTIQRVQVSAAADGDNTVIAAPGAGKALLILGGSLRAVGAGIVILKSGAAGSVADSFTGVVAPGTRLQMTSDPDLGAYLLDTNAALVINNAVGVDTLGFIAYRVISV